MEKMTSENMGKTLEMINSFFEENQIARKHSCFVDKNYLIFLMGSRENYEGAEICMNVNNVYTGTVNGDLIVRDITGTALEFSWLDGIRYKSGACWVVLYDTREKE